MILPLALRQDAEDDIAETMRWYDERSDGLGDVFFDQVEECFDRVQDRPLTFPIVLNPIRRAIVKRFPYCVFFIVREQDIVILAVLHGRRNPKIWQQRRLH